MVKRGSRRPEHSSSDNNCCLEFFKVFFPDKSSHQLRVPPAFIKHFNGTIPTKAILKDASGKFWHVEMEDVENGLFIKNGWERFVNHYSIELGDFLVFRYNGNSSFDVSIFGKNGCRKEDTSVNEKTATIVKIVEETDVQHTSSKHTCDRKRKYSEVGCKISPKSSGLSRPIQLRSQRIAAEVIQDQKIFDTAQTTIPKHPFFVATIGVSRVYGLEIPRGLVTNEHVKFEPQMVFCDQNGKSWPVRVTTRKNGRRSFGYGVRKFLKDNSVKLNDKCIFEFVPGRGSSRNKEIQVKIIRARVQGGCEDISSSVRSILYHQIQNVLKGTAKCPSVQFHLLDERYKKALKSTAKELEALIGCWLEEHKQKRLLGEKGQGRAGFHGCNAEQAEISGSDADTIDSVIYAW